MEKININGEEFVKASEYEGSDHVCIIADRGWIFEGYRESENDYRLKNANVVRSWSNGRGIGGLADSEYKDEYTLDYIGCIEVAERSVIAVIPLRW